MNIWSETAPSKIRINLAELATKAKAFEAYAIQALQLVGDYTGAHTLTLNITETIQNCQVIQVGVSLNDDKWQISLNDSDGGESQQFPSKNYTSSDASASPFSFQLEFPSRWTGTCQLKYPGLNSLPADKVCILQSILSELSNGLHIAMLRQELEDLKARLKEKTKNNREQEKFSNELNREIYYINNIAAIIDKARNETEIVSHVFETTLPFLRAEFGSIFTLETEECLSLLADSTGYRSFENEWLSIYFKNRLFKSGEQPNGLSVKGQPIYDPLLPPPLREYLDSIGIHSVFEFSIKYRDQLYGLGLLGFSEKKDQISGMQIFMIVLNITGLILENFSLLRGLEKQIKLKSQEILEMERQHGPSSERSNAGTGASPSVFIDRILKEVERSRSMALLGELASGVAHQIRNPLNNLVGALHLIKDPDTPEEEKKVLFDRLNERVETLNRMINEFIRYTRIPELNLTSEDINHILDNTVWQFKAWMDLAKIELITDYEPRLPKTKMDLYLINQVYHNVIKNAIEAMHSHGHLTITTRKLKVRHGPKPQLEFVKITFQDTGKGIPEQDLDKVLNPFYSRKEDGLGLGMAIVDHVIRAHGGGVRIKSEAGKGTIVTLYLPIR